jgi:preprotein translocase subunit SecD
MRKVLPLFSLLFILACSGAPPRPAFSDFLEIRDITEDDPLTHQFVSVSGEKYRLGDPVITGRAVNRFQIKSATDERFDMLVTLTGAEDARWRRFARSRIGKQVALVVDGKVRTTFAVADPGAPEEGKLLILTISGVADSQKEADVLEQFIEASKKPVKKEL